MSEKRSNFYPTGEIIDYSLPQSFTKALKGNDKLLIWLSKNELNMVDKVHTTSTVEPLPLIIDAKAEEIDGEEKR